VACVLCVGTDELLMDTRRLLLQRAGHTVVIAADLRIIEAACHERRFDVVVLGDALVPPEKRRVADLVHEVCAGARILELHKVNQRPAVSDADDWMESPAEVPASFAERVSSLAARKGEGD